MNDADLRALLVPWILERDPRALVRHEVELRGVARADVLSVHLGRLAGWEIKSDDDSVRRLRRQVWGYGRVCEECWLVAGDRWTLEASSLVPDWWGVLVHDGSGLFVVREAGRNPDEVSAMLSMLWVPELRLAAKLAGVSYRVSRGKGELLDRLREDLGPTVCLDLARGMLARRVENGWGLRALDAVRRTWLPKEK